MVVLSFGIGRSLWSLRNTDEITHYNHIINNMIMHITIHTFSEMAWRDIPKRTSSSDPVIVLSADKKINFRRSIWKSSSRNSSCGIRTIQNSSYINEQTDTNSVTNITNNSTQCHHAARRSESCRVPSLPRLPVAGAATLLAYPTASPQRHYADNSYVALGDPTGKSYRIIT